MPKINWKVRLRNPHFIAQVALSIILPILSYAGLTAQDMTTWKALSDLILMALSNPYCLGLVVISVYNAVVDNTTPGLSDSENVLRK